MCINGKCEGVHMPRLWPLSQSQVTPAIWFYVCMCKGTEMIQTPQIQPIILQQYCTILFSKVLGSCSELGMFSPPDHSFSALLWEEHRNKAKEWARPPRTETVRGAQGSSRWPFWHRGVWKGSGRDEEYLNKSGSKLFDSVEQKNLTALWDFQLISCFQICRRK